MWLTYKFDYKRILTRYSVRDALNAVMSPTPFLHQTRAEDVADTAEKTKEFLVELVTKLHEKGILTDQDLLELLPHYERGIDDASSRTAEEAKKELDPDLRP